ncbi:MAG: hypothetical protein WC836_12570 [Desulfobacula sp.]
MSGLWFVMGYYQRSGKAIKTERIAYHGSIGSKALHWAALRLSGFGLKR